MSCQSRLPAVVQRLAVGGELAAGGFFCTYFNNHCMQGWGIIHSYIMSEDAEKIRKLIDERCEELLRAVTV